MQTTTTTRSAPAPCAASARLAVDGDRATLDLSFAVPGDAASVRFRFLWLTRESEPWPGGSADDGFSALVDGAAWSGEVALDTGGNLVVGSEVTYDLEGPLDLAGTGFELGSSTGWIRVEVPVAPDSEAGMTFQLWDGGDGVRDSAVLLDAFEYRQESLSAPSSVLEWSRMPWE